MLFMPREKNTAPYLPSHFYFPNQSSPLTFSGPMVLHWKPKKYTWHGRRPPTRPLPTPLTPSFFSWPVRNQDLYVQSEIRITISLLHMAIHESRTSHIAIITVAPLQSQPDIRLARPSVVDQHLLFPIGRRSE